MSTEDTNTPQPSLPNPFGIVVPPKRGRGRPRKIVVQTEHQLTYPNENPDIGREGAADQIQIPAGVAGVWHSHKKQGVNPQRANIMGDARTWAMIIPIDESTCRFLIRVDLINVNGVSTAITSVDLGIEDAMSQLNENYIQTRFTA